MCFLIDVTMIFICPSENEEHIIKANHSLRRSPKILCVLSSTIFK